MTKTTSYITPFNSPIEFGLRLIILLEYAYPAEYDLQRLVFYDYLLVHSKDANGPESIHPPTPHRSGEVLVKRHLLEQGILLLISRYLVMKKYTKEGIMYQATDSATPFVDSLASLYTEQLKVRAKWVVETFKSSSGIELENFFFKNLDRWGGEFERDAVLKYGDL